MELTINTVLRVYGIWVCLEIKLPWSPPILSQFHGCTNVETCWLERNSQTSAGSKIQTTQYDERKSQQPPAAKFISNTGEFVAYINVHIPACSQFSQIADAYKCYNPI